MPDTEAASVQKTGIPICRHQRRPIMSVRRMPDGTGYPDVHPDGNDSVDDTRHRMRFSNDQFYLKSEDEMRKHLRIYSGGVSITRKKSPSSVT